VTARRETALKLVNDAAEAVTRLGPWVALLWATALPTRLLLALLIVRLVDLKGQAMGAGNYLTRLAYAVLATWLASLWGRQIFVCASRHALQSIRPPSAATFKVPLRELAGHFSAALAIALLFWSLLLTVVAPLALLVASGLAAAAAHRSEHALLGSVRQVARSAAVPWVLVRLLFVFALALPLVAVNLHLLLTGALWLLGGIAGLDRSGWAVVLSIQNPLYVVLIVLGALLLIEPFWLAALTSHVEYVGAKSTGDDLRRRFEELRSAA